VAGSPVRARARDLGVVIGQWPPGPLNALTDVAGVRVGHTTLIEGDGPLVVGRGPIRTGVTAVMPHGGDPWRAAVYAGCHRLNGNGELTGLEWIRESGLLTGPVALTNTHSVGVVRDAIIAAEVRERGTAETYWALPVVGETYDGQLNDMNGQHVRPDHLFAALDGAAGGPVAEGNVGGGTGMICHEFKGGIGTASRIVPADAGGFTVGALVQANHGRRERLTVSGVPVGLEIAIDEVPSAWDRTPAPPGSGSIIVILATDAPLLPHQCERLAQRAGLGIARSGGAGENSSGDLFLAFATGNVIDGDDFDAPPRLTREVTTLGDPHMSALFWAAIEATEEAILNALLAAETMVGRDGHTAYELPHDRLRDVMGRYGRGREQAAAIDR
jgi:D-aminopeptidase